VALRRCGGAEALADDGGAPVRSQPEVLRRLQVAADDAGERLDVLHREQRAEPAALEDLLGAGRAPGRRHRHAQAQRLDECHAEPLVAARVDERHGPPIERGEQRVVAVEVDEVVR